MEALPLRPELRGRSPYGAPQPPAEHRLNTNENPHPLPPALLADLQVALAEAATGLNRYPDRDATALRADLAAYLTRTSGEQVDPAQVWAANGSNEVLQQVLQTFGGAGRTALGFTPSYSMHPILSAGTGTAWVDGHRRADFTIDPAAAAAQVREVRPDVVFVTSPNNPTGTAVELDTIAALYEATSYDDGAGVLVVDEAYTEFARTGTVSALSLLPGRPRLIVSRTMSKAFGMAGLRLGYLAADPTVVDALQLVRLPYHLSSLTQAAARAALAHTEQLLATVALVKAERDRIVAALPGMGLTSVPSDANFVLFGHFTDSAAAWQALLDRGVLVRDVGLPGWLRVTAGTTEETDAFLTALGEVAPAHRSSLGGSPA
ncbi:MULTISPECIES: histidinol-phosphate transaminase [unclassified Modestobacter]|uniref:histidinol-phosphate transaminase n=1 Tax=unclassified Modestobacter TaxID=2643866 RepID=UPI0022AB2638|nr:MULTISPECIES: histidinol-phosphate transaminase [unclassified Modestobacter]MCZ2812934.1 histidinol-phosphate transaminase [Modestobacter sp. VKM Ac-2979]MCZ2843037.1 histidinol-phosphate transaminase [Modestobacter sp. VKM Ac-2980]MCZ2847644.1 histidinol-phosphate transaminase [Modestobacter sp. VKM Ac-2978]